MTKSAKIPDAFIVDYENFNPRLTMMEIIGVCIYYCVYIISRREAPFFHSDFSLPVECWCCDGVSVFTYFIVGTTSFVGAIPKYKKHSRQSSHRLLLRIAFHRPKSFCTRKWIVPAIREIVYQGDSFTLSKRVLILGIFAVLMIPRFYLDDLAERNLERQSSIPRGAGNHWRDHHRIS